MSSTTNLVKKIWTAYQNGRLFSGIYWQIYPILSGLKYLIFDPGSKRIKLHCPDYIEPCKDANEVLIVRRIYDAFIKMKESQKTSSNIYLPSPLWQQYLNEGYSYLSSGLKTNSIEDFHFFLSNFGGWKAYHAVEHTTLIRNNMKSIVGRKYLINDLFNKQLRLWEWFYNKRKPVSYLSYPTYGNQIGAIIDGDFVGPVAFFNEIYGSILSEIISDVNSPVVAELGAGYGRLAYFCLRDLTKFTYIDFDLPETLCLAAYYLMKIWPDKKVLLYGEEEFNYQSHDKYDLIFMPPQCIEQIGQNTVNLFINAFSLGEMTKKTAMNYVTFISQSTNYFFHINHDNYPRSVSDGKKGPLGHEYSLPEKYFKKIFRYPDIGNLMLRGYLDFRSDLFIYLYERRAKIN
ncbi:MAG: putative sugar O-methyltransferase [Proteobacteria bacterium]|nr:putative sugar O-methyltransferase [Pseudomonadota bacterium]